jgi:uncharacterized protein (DUF1330 family)
MGKGYWIVRLEVGDMNRFKDYLSATPEALGKYGGRFLVRGGQFEAVEGESCSRNSIIEFPSYHAALDCYHSPEYQAAKLLRAGAATMNLLIIEGL